MISPQWCNAMEIRRLGGVLLEPSLFKSFLTIRLTYSSHLTLLSKLSMLYKLTVKKPRFLSNKTSTTKIQVRFRYPALSVDLTA